MTKTEKIIVGSTFIIGASAVAMLMMSKKYDVGTEQLRSDLSDIRYTLSKSREELIILNKETVEGNRILRKIVKDSVNDFTDDNR